MWSIGSSLGWVKGQVLLWVHHLALARPQVPYSGPGPGIWDLNLVGLDFKDLANVVLNFAMSFCISLA